MQRNGKAVYLWDNRLAAAGNKDGIRRFEQEMELVHWDARQNAASKTA